MKGEAPKPLAQTCRRIDVLGNVSGLTVKLNSKKMNFNNPIQTQTNNINPTPNAELKLALEPEVAANNPGAATATNTS